MNVTEIDTGNELLLVQENKTRGQMLLRNARTGEYIRVGPGTPFEVVGQVMTPTFLIPSEI